MRPFRCAGSVRYDVPRHAHFTRVVDIDPTGLDASSTHSRRMDPFFDKANSLWLLASTSPLNAGTGFVHTAPAHGDG